MKKYFKWLLPILVISIIGSVVTMPNVDSHGYWLGKSKSDIRMLEAVVHEYWQDHKQLPSADEGLIGLVNAARKENDTEQKRYLNRLPRDYWGNNYVYSILEEGKKFKIYSTGPDAVDNEGMGDDVVIGDKHYSCEVYDDCLTSKDYVYRAFLMTTLISIMIILVMMMYFIYIYLKGRVKGNNVGKSIR
jgi:general secretion pathway protein G